MLTTTLFPDDFDTTSIACTVLDHYSERTKNEIMDEMLTLRNRDGIVQTYFDSTRPRIGTCFTSSLIVQLNLMCMRQTPLSR